MCICIISTLRRCAITLCDMENITLVGSKSDSVHFLWE